MNFEINTGYNRAFQWIEADNIYFIGYLNTQKGLIPDSISLKEIFNGCKTEHDYKTIISQLNGIFSIIICNQEWLMIASDSTRFFPIFYTVNDKKIYVSDDIEFIREKSQTNGIDKTGKLEFLAGAYTASHRTLFEKVFQVRPMEILVGKNNKITTGYYGRFSQLKSETTTLLHEDLLIQIKNTINAVFNRLIENLKDKKIALPLSSGYDSRLIACKLKEFGCKDVLCFTYGQKTKEVEISKRVANVLGFPWYFVEYTSDLIRDFHRTSMFQKYYHYAARGTSMFYLQEYPALKYLFEKQIINSDYYALPGHSGDLLRGALLVKTYPENVKREHLPKLILDQKFIHAYITKSEKRLLKEQITDHVNELDSDNSLIPYSVLEDWEMKERTSKYIFNSAHVFTFFGIKTFFPLWDKDLFECFRILPSFERKYGKLYKEVIVKEFFIPNNVWFHDELNPTRFSTKIDFFKKKLRPCLPKFIKEKLLIKNDWAFYGPMTKYLLNDLQRHDINPVSNGSSYLYRILNWYLMKITSNEHF